MKRHQISVAIEKGADGYFAFYPVPINSIGFPVMCAIEIVALPFASISIFGI